LSSIDDDIKATTKNLNDNASDLSKVVDILLNNKWSRRKTRLRSQLIVNIAVLDTIAQIWDVTFLKDFIANYTEYVTSEGGKGRQEIVDITKFTIDRQNQNQKDILEALGRR